MKRPVTIPVLSSATLFCCAVLAAEPAAAPAPVPSESGMDWAKLPANAWVPVRPVTVQPEAADEQGKWQNVGWNKLIYDAGNRRVLFNDRWIDKKHGGYTIYGNCVFAFEPAGLKLTPLRFTNWTRQVPGRNYKYKTVPRDENVKEPTPCDRHVYAAFAYAPDLDAVLITNGANRGAEADGKIGHVLCADTWRLDLATRKWSRVESKEHPPSQHESAMDYCPATKAVVYAGHQDIWMLDVAAGQWRRSKARLPEGHMGLGVTWDAPRGRMLIAGGGAYGKSGKKGQGFEMVYALDPKGETLKRLADCPTAIYLSSLVHDTKRDLFFHAAKMGSGSENPSGVFYYDPKSDKWAEVKAAGGKSIDEARTPMCYDAEHDCLLGVKGYDPNFYAFRYELEAQAGSGEK